MKSTSGEPKSENERSERQDWWVVLLILLIGFCCVTAAGQLALRFSPNWTLDTNMESNLDPDSDFSVKPSGFFEPIDSAILTQPAWVKVFLTPGAKFTTGTPPAAAANTTVPTSGAPTVSVTGTIPVVTNTPVPTNTFIWLPPPPTTNTRRPRPADTPIPPPNATLQITIVDNATEYAPGTPRIYTITVSNTVPGSSDVTGATVQNIFPPQITGVIPVLGPGVWCVTTGGATCGWTGTINIHDTVNLPFGSTITYQFETTTAGGGNLVNTASVSLPAGYTGPSPVSATDTDTFISPVPPPGDMGNPGVPPGSGCNLLNVGDVITFSVPATIDDDGTPDLIYYEELQAPGILMDEIVIEISDGLNWYPLLNWGDGAQNDNTTNLLLPILGPTGCGWSEIDNCEVDPGLQPVPLYNNAGILLNIPPILQNGPNSFIRITVPPPGGGPNDNNVCIDALVPYP